MIRRTSFVILAWTVLVYSGCGYVKQSYLDSFVSSEKQNLPKMLFSSLKAVDVESGPGELIYVCENKRLNDEQTKQAHRKTQMALQDYVKKNKDKLEDLISNKIKLTIAIQGKNGDELYRITVNPWEL